MTLNPIQAAELILIMEWQALEAENKGHTVDAECIRTQSGGLIQAIENVDDNSPGYAAECIRAMTEKEDK